jgi:hypothetical protein
MKKNIKKEDEEMQVSTQTQVPALPLPQNEKKRLMQAEVNQELFDLVHKEMKRKDLKIRSIMEWGLRAFLLASNPKEAARFGIRADDVNKKDR